MFGVVTTPASGPMEDLNWRENAPLVPLIILCFWIGIYPKPIFRVLERPVQLIVEQVNPGYYGAERASAPGVNAAPAAPGQTGAVMPGRKMPAGMNMPPAATPDDNLDIRAL